MHLGDVLACVDLRFRLLMHVHWRPTRAEEPLGCRWVHQAATVFKSAGTQFRFSFDQRIEKRQNFTDPPERIRSKSDKSRSKELFGEVLRIP
jgi:hypothetical protein